MAKSTSTTEEVPPEPAPAPEPAPPTPSEQLTEEVEPTKAETIQSQGIGPLDPYPTGNPPPAKTYAEINQLPADQPKP